MFVAAAIVVPPSLFFCLRLSTMLLCFVVAPARCFICHGERTCPRLTLPAHVLVSSGGVHDAGMRTHRESCHNTNLGEMRGVLRVYALMGTPLVVNTELVHACRNWCSCHRRAKWHIRE